MTTISCISYLTCSWDKMPDRRNLRGKRSVLTPSSKETRYILKGRHGSESVRQLLTLGPGPGSRAMDAEALLTPHPQPFLFKSGQHTSLYNVVAYIQGGPPCSVKTLWKIPQGTPLKCHLGHSVLLCVCACGVHTLCMSDGMWGPKLMLDSSRLGFLRWVLLRSLELSLLLWGDLAACSGNGLPLPPVWVLYPLNSLLSPS